MAYKKYLDQGGVSHLWNKVKAYLDNRFGTGTISVDETSYFGIDYGSRLSMRATSLSVQLNNSIVGHFISGPSVSINFSTNSHIEITNQCQVKICVLIISSTIQRDVIDVGMKANLRVTSFSPYILISVPWANL